VSKLVFSGRELFLSDASLFVDDAEAYDNYDRQEERDQTNEQEVVIFSFLLFVKCFVFILCVLEYFERRVKIQFS
jgi:heme/copper-type cytochrome/quinol oxidase subunit 3